jgi:hypothetical protein
VNHILPPCLLLHVLPLINVVILRYMFLILSRGVPLLGKMIDLALVVPIVAHFQSSCSLARPLEPHLYLTHQNQLAILEIH